MTRRGEGWAFVGFAALALFGWVVSPILSLIGAGLLVAAFLLVGLGGR